MQKRSINHIVCLALPAWEAEYLRSTVELMTCLAKTNLVLYVDYPYTISDFIKGLLGKKKFEWKRLLGIRQRLQKVFGDTQTGLYVLSLPPVFPSFNIGYYPLFKVANKINAVLTGWFINRAIEKLKMANIVEFNASQTFLGNYWKIKGVDFKVLYTYDEFTDVPYFRGFARTEELNYTTKSNLIVVTSNELKIRKQYKNIPIEIVNNGVHFADFNRHANYRLAEHRHLKIVGYTGSIDDRLDVNLLDAVIQAMQNVNFVFIGKVFEPAIVHRLGQHSNVLFLPAVPAKEIPIVLSSMDAGMIPYVCNKLTAAIYPLKANEYLAVGLPVVMTPFASIGEADEVVYVANNAILFERQLALALIDTEEKQVKKRIEVAQKADWSARAYQLQDYIELHRAAYHQNQLS
ncbi:hypothetical protein A0256_01210 [Mucilaginibacter sp. PAMC 26640]|nr:hypothetical protein A0256_01210 [Mucilaginibacter sp. PAMC 26640]